MSFIVKDKQLFQKCNKIREKIERFMKINVDSKPFYGSADKICIKTKIKTFKDNITTNIYNKKVPKEKEQYKCLSIIILDSVLKAYEKCHPQTYLEECKYKQQKQKQKLKNNYINEDLKSDNDSNDETKSDSDNNEINNNNNNNNNKSLIVYVNHALLDFYFLQSV